MTLEKVDSLIARVEAKHPKLGRAAMATYYESVHQELAPLARALERRVEELEAQVQAGWRQAAKERRPTTRTVYTCTACLNVYKAGEPNVTVYGLNGRAWCGICIPFDKWQRDATPMTESQEPCPKSQ